MSVKIYLKSERGEAGTKLLIFLVVVFFIAFAGFNYVPVAYKAASFKQEMETAVIKGFALPSGGKTVVQSVQFKLKNAMADNDVPGDAFMEVKQIKNVVQARVHYQKQVDLLPFGIYKYDYVFDHTATPAGFLTKDN